MTAVWIGCALALMPALLIAWNLSLLRRPERSAAAVVRTISVLIPARDEAGNIGAAVESVLANRDAFFELIVLDDHSSDATASIVAAVAQRDARVRLVAGAPLPVGWQGKPFACQQLADAARGELLVFMDADVRLAGDALTRLVSGLETSGAAMLSGIPRQIMPTWGERLIVPLMHFIMYGYLPMALMRARSDPALGAACGQLLIVDRDAYARAGGHAAIATRVHDGLALARAFRVAGFTTDLADFTDLASCRMYRSWGQVWRGFAKNAHEGLGSARGIVPWTLILLGGQIAPLALLAWSVTTADLGAWPLLGAALASLGARTALALRFEQALLMVLLHPFGVIVLVGLQWYALALRLLHRPVGWKGRSVDRSGRFVAEAEELESAVDGSGREQQERAVGEPRGVAERETPERLSFEARPYVATGQQQLEPIEIKPWIYDLDFAVDGATRAVVEHSEDYAVAVDVEHVRL